MTLYGVFHTHPTATCVKKYKALRIQMIGPKSGYLSLKLFTRPAACFIESALIETSPRGIATIPAYRRRGDYSFVRLHRGRIDASIEGRGRYFLSTFFMAP
jgi:hypothetical protein